MSSTIRNYVRNLERGQETAESLPGYVEEYMGLHFQCAQLRLMMEYYMFYEAISEGINPYISSAQDMAEQYHGLLAHFLEKPQDADGIAERLLTLRGEVMDRMQVLTTYVDCFVVYEYILNRVQYRFEDREMMPADEVFGQDLVRFIFSGDDSAVVSDRIRAAVEQLPVRMTRSRYFQLIRDSISVYQGGDVDSLEGFLYMFRTCAMLYQDKNRDKYFTEFGEVLRELSELDYENIERETYVIYEGKLRTNTAKLNDISDLYMQLGQLINHLYTLCAAWRKGGALSIPQAERVLQGVNALFLGQESPVWQQAGETPVGSEEEKLYWLGEQFVAVEGRQERLSEAMNVAGAALEGLEESYREEINASGLSEDFEALDRMFLFTSGSVFADLKKGGGEKVTPEMADRAAGELIEECRQFFQGAGRMVRRAVMANTLGAMPVLFSSAQEVADYVMASLAGCDDEAEKYAAKLLLLDIMR